MNKKSNNKQKIIIISDIWGKQNSDWISHYTSIVEKHFDVQLYDSCDLAEIDFFSEIENKHHQFINGGIEKAVASLLQKETDIVNILAFSIGGTITWKAALFGLKIQNLFAVSSTRLRYETQKLAGNIELFYGALDAYKPDENWFHLMELVENIYENEEHAFYRKKEIAEKVCEMIIRKVNQN
ncbi:alpha/beta hydrolase [Kaistella flava (ex Peng et al. 2021)]|uniref:Alpha/beta hydrolase n=1 Tax=Kaistella flava (ex Peng et al. 2021) TaxID=2038776 RepID=A0A7M2Y9B0_9FLAO|nr:alpha/beta hydrolase [Kaistella flava (ex Peng et al. 2021)]QOW10245.1 alpha/beta hydrolase [Kaistella flava (ex Peng et al. 2021)]